MKKTVLFLISFLVAPSAFAHSGHPAVMETGLLHYLGSADHLIVLAGVLSALAFSFIARGKRAAQLSGFVAVVFFVLLLLI